MPFFIEVGTCDFDTLEKLAKNGWDGIMVEPVKEYMDKLPKFDNIHYENIAITDIKDDVDIHYINPNNITQEHDEWMKGISSINGSSGPLHINSHIDEFKDFLKLCNLTNKLNDTLAVAEMNKERIRIQCHYSVLTHFPCRGDSNSSRRAAWCPCEPSRPPRDAPLHPSGGDGSLELCQGRSSDRARAKCRPCPHVRRPVKSGCDARSYIRHRPREPPPRFRAPYIR